VGGGKRKNGVGKIGEGVSLSQEMEKRVYLMEAERHHYRKRRRQKLYPGH